MYGVQIAFKDFSPSQGIEGSPWVGFANFQTFFNSFQSKNLIWNTVTLSLYNLIAGFPFPIILALMVNQIRVKRFKQVLQVVTYLPHFISTVVMAVSYTHLHRVFILPEIAPAAFPPRKFPLFPEFVRSQAVLSR